jgi:hypothetical protein
MQGATQAATAADDFSDVFEREDRDRGAETAAPVEPAQQPRDESGRFAAKQTEEPPAKTAEPEKTAQAEPPPTSEPETTEASRHVPLKELLSERERYKSERKLREEAERRAIEHEAQLKAMREVFQQQRQPPQQHREPPQRPDPFTQPEEFAQYQAEQQHYARRTDIANMSERIARRMHGDELVEKATQWALSTGRNTLYFNRAADPYGELVDDFQKFQVISEIGPDPAKYKASLRDQIRAEVLAELKAGGTKPPPKFPGTLADATQAGSQGAMLSPEVIAHEIFDTNRNRRQY